MRRAGCALGAVGAVACLGAAPSRPSCPTVARVDVLVTSDLVVTTEEVVVPRGAVPDGAFETFVAFGAPGVPRAADASLVPLEEGELEAPPERKGKAVPLVTVNRKPATSSIVLGRGSMAGVVVKVAEADRRRAAERGGAVAVRVRFAYDSPPTGPDGAREVLVRLGEASGVPLTLGRVRIVGPELGGLGAVAKLCGPEAEERPLAVRFAGGALASPPPVPGSALPLPSPVAPVLAVRHASDDLCVRVVALR